MNEPFWFVWNPNGRVPVYQHPSAKAAVAEAERLARLNSGETFVVLQSVCAVQVNDIQRTDLRPNIDDIPF